MHKQVAGKRWMMRAFLVLGALLGPAAWGAATAPTTTRGAADPNAPAREKFLTVERFARLPADEQAKGLAAFYRDIVPGALNSVYLEILSSAPADLLNRENRVFGGGPEQWARQLQAAAPQMTAEEVADNLGTLLWFNVAAHSRTMRVLRDQEKLVAPLVEADLDSPEVAPFERGCRVVRELKLTQYTGKILEVQIAGGPRAQAAHDVLVWLRDPALLERLRAEVVRDPKTLARHAGLIQGPLYGEKADPEIAKLLSSPDAEIRYWAAYALMECKDETLAKPIAALAKEAATRTQEVALKMASKLSAEAFVSIRGDLVPLLRSADAAVQDAAIKAFAGHKDLAVAPVIREFLTKPPAKPGGGYNVTITQALNALTGSMFGYDYLHWGPEKNADAISKFDEWVLQHGGTVELPFKP